MTHQHNLFEALHGTIGSEFLLDCWTHISDKSTRELVIPDGCQDPHQRCLEDLRQRSEITNLIVPMQL